MNNIYIVGIIFAILCFVSIVFIYLKKRSINESGEYDVKEFDTLLMADITIFFKEKYPLVLKEHPEAKAIALKTPNNSMINEKSIDNLGNSIVCTFYNDQSGEIISNQTLVCKYKILDEILEEKFGDKEMLVLS